MKVRVSDAVALAVVVVALAAVAILATPQPTPYSDTYSTHDSDRGGYLAWFRLLQRSGLRVERFETHPSSLDGSIGTLIVANNGFFSQSDVAPLASFVRAGGSLVWVSAGADERDPAWRPLHFPHWQRRTARHAAIVPLVPSVATRGVRTLYGEGHAEVPPRAFPAVVPLMGGRTGAVVARYAVGRGRVTVVTDPTFFVNRNLARAGNAQFALSLALQRAGGVAFDEQIHGYGTERSIWSVLPLPLRAATVALAVIGLLALVGAGLRTVPLAAVLPEQGAARAGYLVSLATLLRRGRASASAAEDLASSTFAACGRELGLVGKVDERRLVAAYRARGEDAAARTVREIARLLSVPALGEAELVAIAERCFMLRKGRKDAGTRRRRTPAG